MHSWILASESPRRKELLEGIGLIFDIVAAKTDESFSGAAPPGKTAENLALAKCLYAAALHKKSVIIAADTLVAANGGILGKPKDAKEAADMLRALSGRTHRVYTGLAVAFDGKTAARVVCTNVRFKVLDESVIRLYLASKEPFDKAGAYGIQGRGSFFVEWIKGDYFNVVGLPLSALYDVLREEFDIDLFSECGVK